MLNRGAAFVVGCVLGLLCACEARPNVGASCERTSDCVEPLACVAGRCREECVEQRDCPLDGLCVEQAPGVRGCIPPDERCGDFCESPLVCRDDRCGNPCADSSECFGGACADGVCRTVAPHDAGPRDAGVLDAGPRDAGVLDAAPRDAGDASAGAQGRPCETSSNCGVGARCADGRCLVECAVAGDECPAGTRCNELGRAFPDDYHAGLPAGTGLCSDLCDPVTQTGCPSALTCDILAASGGLFYTYCRRTGPRASGAACDFSGQCEDATICEVTSGFDAGAPGRFCLGFCGPVTETCPAGFACGMTATTESGIDFGVCNEAP